MLLLLYEYEKNKSESDFIISKYFLYEFESIDDIDKQIIIGDWHTIINKIKAGRGAEISESDTYYLGACTKGANKLSTTSQPFSAIPVKTRAYALKNSYMTSLFREKIFNDEHPYERFIKNVNLLKKSTFEELIYQSFTKFKNKSLTDIDKMLSKPVNRKDKSYISNYVARMMKITDSAINQIEEFNKANIKIKTIRVMRNGRIRESMSFPAFNFVELSKEDWETSEIRDMFINTKFLFVIFDEIDDSQREYKLRNVKLWVMPPEDLDIHVHKAWRSTREILKGALVVDIKNGCFMNNFPGSKINPVSHLRPHGKNSGDTLPLPDNCIIRIDKNDGTKDIQPFIDNHVFTKQCFWLNNSYISKIIGEV